ncbi:MAG: alpha/beta fold hydrolase [Nitrospira sp. SB0662_bin_26]|nr:alpha/beta fold hydrolase [Nitrospira sp. SB0662_bin_26]
MVVTPRDPASFRIPSHVDLLHRHAVHAATVNGHRVAYLDHGEGPPVILIHGLGGSMWHWEHQQTALARSYRVITPDMLGSGLSEKPECQYSPTFLLDTFRTFMDTLHVQQATLIGSSMGAGIAMGMSLEHPDRVTSLVLIGGFPANLLDNMQSSRTRRFITHRPPLWLSKLGSRITGRWSIKLILQEIIHNHALISSMVVERVHRLRFQPGFFEAMYSQLDQIPEWEATFAPHLTDVAHSTLILWGASDRVFSPSVGQTLQTTIPGSSFLLAPNSGHLLQWENPDFVNAAILQFLASEPAG